MVLSSNWLEFQKKSSDAGSNKRKSTKKTGEVFKGNHHTKKKPSRVMNVVYTMNEAIDRAEKDKKLGKEFNFRPTTESKVDVLLGKDTVSKRMKDAGKFVALDGEFVGVGIDGKEHALARVSVVNYNGYVVMDEYVKPQEKVVDWRTWVSGIEPKHMKNAISYKEAQQRVADILKDRILVGHAVSHDLAALGLKHARSMIRDTSLYPPFRKQYAKGKTPGLKKLANEVLKINIQEGQHSSVEDARITMLLYKSHKKEIDRLYGGKLDV
ncbi:REX4 (YOL080C) [Zygosaccharomyces parabailii]|uniref:RNA exonuclease 4 n=1 Tax=Zygosaccharomyces bailii (strain CLIB 213 / ATCC 58445 / CBS 680 / BCRC 21525 / NBRC 1098 / NCYC 1416 / NRRL Y-2227) TaxID=1333698 RepID=A0A8J2T371_ZYGB2|nr:REX4 (YOL080C) [Zygosaccharomyces parabailii]CDF87614.1 BN860_10440g1_1 [Zygosaccharomyces bailii CLIB 213]CDH15333.1 related to RNA exonuclease 4 [Zygosaccharomyces bailii ISA1307]SJM87822.1 related to RNA exonuclease 4 [Zygosaccharomyces bailii]